MSDTVGERVRATERGVCPRCHGEIKPGQWTVDGACEPGEPLCFGPAEKNPAAVALGALGASKGGKARAAKLSAKRRSAIAAKGGRAARGVPRKARVPSDG
jgi:hypothetical protein